MIVASGRKIKDKLQARVKKDQDLLRTHLYDLAQKLDRSINETVKGINTELSVEPKQLDTYVKFVEQVNLAKEKEKELDSQLKQFTEMKNVLSKYRVKDDTSFTNTHSKVSQLQNKIDNLTEQISKIAATIEEANKKAKDNKQTNVDQLVVAIESENDKLKTLIENIESESLMSKATPLD